MNEAALKTKEYISVEEGVKRSFGGRQHWLAEAGKPTLAECGCGAVAAADLFLYLARSRPEWETPLCAPLARSGSLSTQSYCEYCREVARLYARPLPKLGKTGLGLSLGIERYFADNRINLRAEWRQAFLSRGIRSDYMNMLQNDLPVVMSIPAFPLKIKSLNFYRAASTKKAPADAYRYRERAGHFVTACALRPIGEGLALEISSWGRRFYLDWEEYLHSARRGAGLLTCGYILLRPSV